MSVIFQSIDQKMHISIICKNTDKFTKIENEIYEKEDFFLDQWWLYGDGTRSI